MPFSHRLRFVCIMVGGFLGPFAAQSLAIVMPEFAADFGISLRLASLTMTAYMMPFAAVMLFSTYVVRNVSPSRVVRVAYAVIAAASVVLVAAPRWWIFLVAYVVAGVANAFTAPLLQLILRHIMPPDQLGKALGTYAAMQSFGIFSAPLVAGASVTVGSWRLMYALLLAFALAIVVLGLPDTPAPGQLTGQKVFGWPVVRACLTLLSVGLGVIGMGFVISLHVGSLFDAPPLTRGAIVMAGGLTAFVFARRVGAVADVRGPRPVMIASLLIAAAAMFGIGFMPWMLGIAALWGVAVLAAQGVQVGVNILVLRSPAGGQILSTVQAFRFFGNALPPLVVLPVYGVSAVAGFGMAAASLGVMALLNARGAARGVGRD